MQHLQRSSTYPCTHSSLWMRFWLQQHLTCPRVCQEVNQDVLCAQLEQVVPGRLEQLLPLLHGRHVDLLHHLHSKVNDGKYDFKPIRAAWCSSLGEGPAVMAGCAAQTLILKGSMIVFTGVLVICFCASVSVCTTFCSEAADFSTGVEVWNAVRCKFLARLFHSA